MPLPHGTSFLAMRAALPARADSVEKDGLRIFSRNRRLSVLSAILLQPPDRCAHGTDNHP